MKLALAIAFALVEIASCLEIAQAQFSPRMLGASKQTKPIVTDGPRRTVPGTVRGPCEKTDIPFTPLLPDNGAGFSGYTLTEHPTFWFYVPYKTSSVRSAKFSLSLEGQPNNQVYQTDLKLPETPGFVSVTLPSAEKPLEKNKAYRWTFTLYCASQDSLQPPKAWHTGTVQRVDMPALATQLKAATGKESINLYRENRIWYDAPTDLAKKYDFSQAWGNLLEAIGLKQLDREPIAGSVPPIER